MGRLRVTITALALLMAAVASALANNVSLAGDEAVTNLRWKAGVIRIAISSSLLRDNPNIKRDSDVAGAIKRSIDAWSRVANIELQQVGSEKQSASPSGPAGDGVSLITIAATPENVLLFAKDPENAAATTRVFYNRRGTITEADIVLNPYQQFSTDGTLGSFDLESTLTHEIGHLLGLQHSSVFGSTMHANYGKNGLFGLQNFSSRTLSADDIAAVRAIYGSRSDDDDNCCGNVEGKLSLAPSKQPRNIEVWMEDSEGRVSSSGRTTTGEFHFAGLMAGKYRVFAQESSKGRTASAVRNLGDVAVANAEIATLNQKLPAGLRDFDLNYLGFNGQLSEMAVSLSAGRSYTIYLGGRNLDPKRLSVSFTSPHITVVSGSLRSHDYGDDVSVVSLEIRIASRTPKGDYTIYAESDRGDRRAIVGGITVDNFANPWSSFANFEE
jgi:hypothetical protein